MTIKIELINMKIYANITHPRNDCHRRLLMVWRVCEVFLKGKILTRSRRRAWCENRYALRKYIQKSDYKQPLLEILIENELKKMDIPYQKQVLLCAIAIVDFYLPHDKTIIQCDDRWHKKLDCKEKSWLLI